MNTLVSFIYVVNIAISGVDVTQVGPFATYSGCEGQERTISSDIKRSFDTSFPFGMSPDIWLGASSIIFFDDYEIKCVRVEI